MSGIAGIYQRDGAPVSAQRIEDLLKAVSYRGPDAGERWLKGSVGLGHALFATTPESVGERQPLEDESRLLCLTFDGRIDNREEVEAALLAQGARLRTRTDAELVLAAYACWGEACPQRLIGDFAFALWDGQAQRLFCARDILGIRPFYYMLDDRRFSFSSDLGALVRSPEYSPAPNLGMVGEYLSDNIVSLTDTLYQDIVRLPPAHCLTVQGERTTLRRYHRLDPSTTVRYRSDHEYAEHFLDIFRQALLSRLRSREPAGLFLSGGLDSSAIFCLARQMERDGTLPAGSLTPYSLVFAHPDADEQRHLQNLLRYWNAQGHCESAVGWSETPLDEQIRRSCDFPDLPNTPPWSLLFAKTRSHGRRVVLDGFGSDEWLTGDSAHCADLIRQGKWFAACRQIWIDRAVSRDWGGYEALDPLRWCLFPFIPRSLKNRLKRPLRWDVPAWITPTFANAVDLQGRLLNRPTTPRFATFAQQEMSGQLASGWGTLEFELIGRFDAQQGMESRHPFCDRRLIEFALAIPEEQRWRGYHTKYILRQAMQGLSPSSLLARTSKADFSYLYRDRIAKELAGYVQPGGHLVAAELLDRRQTDRLFLRCAQGETAALGPAWMVLALDRWYGTMFGGLTPHTSLSKAE